MGIDKLLNPKSIAVIGASYEKKKLGYQILANLRAGGYKGKIYPINRKAGKISGLRVFSDITYIPEVVDLVEIVIPAQYVADEIRKCAAKGIKNIIIISAGFSESSAEGKVREDEIKKIAAEFKLNILGPNCLGLISTGRKLNASFAKANANVGSIGFISQSGAIGSAVLDWADKKSVGFSNFVSLGNKAVLDENDFFEYFIDDKKTEIVVAYLENIKDGQRFLRVVSALAKIKPVAILKAGRSKAGAHAALSHTGSLAGSDKAIEAAFARCGVLVLEDIGEMFDLMLFYRQKLGLINDKVFVVSNAGGPLVLATDEISRCGLQLGNLNGETKVILEKKLPPIVKVQNPLDLIGDADSERYKIALEAILKDKNVSNLLVLLTPQTSSEIDKTAEIISILGNKYKNKIICVSFIGGESLENANKILSKNKIINFNFPYQAIKVLAKLSRNQKERQALRPYKEIQEAIVYQPIGKQADYWSSLGFLDKYGIKSVKTNKINSVEDLNDLKYPIAMKVVGEKLIHKTEEKAVVLNIKDADQAALVFYNFKNQLKLEENYCLAQEMVEGVEIILGFKRDEFFGPILIVGWGGIYAETINDLQLVIGDIDIARAEEALKKLKVYKILKGARGQAECNIKALAAAIVSLGKMARENTDINELDINPLFVNQFKAIATDIRIIK